MGLIDRNIEISPDSCYYFHFLYFWKLIIPVKGLLLRCEGYLWVSERG